MKIETYDIAFASQHSKTSEHRLEESFRLWTGDRRPDFEGRGVDQRGVTESTRVAISQAAHEAAKAAKESEIATETSDVTDIDKILQDLDNDEQLQLLIRLVEALTGRKIRLLDGAALRTLEPAAASDTAADMAKQAGQGRPQETEQRHGWGLEYDRRETVRETERSGFEAQGVIRTADGKTIEFSLSLEMKREFFSESNVSLRAGDGVRKDPLVINFGGNAMELGSEKFSFDLDADGISEYIPFVSPDSGFLAFDRNGNGTIDDGSELFGALTGNGFAELAAHDDDGNGWIDENDAIYARLLVWTRDAVGQESLKTLAEHGIGALYLGNAASPFDLKDSSNVQHGQIRNSGVFLYEDGRAGTMQQIDLIV